MKYLLFFLSIDFLLCSCCRKVDCEDLQFEINNNLDTLVFKSLDTLDNDTLNVEVNFMLNEGAFIEEQNGTRRDGDFCKRDHAYGMSSVNGNVNFLINVTEIAQKVSCSKVSTGWETPEVYLNNNEIEGRRLPYYERKMIQINDDEYIEFEEQYISTEEFFIEQSNYTIDTIYFEEKGSVFLFHVKENDLWYERVF